MVAPTKESTEDFASEFLNVMGRIRRLRKYLRGCDSATLITMRDRLNELIGERESEEIAELEAAEAKLRSIAEVKKLMEERGLSDDDLLTTEALQEATAKGAKKVRKPKYLYIDEEKNEDNIYYIDDLLDKVILFDDDDGKEYLGEEHENGTRIRGEKKANAWTRFNFPKEEKPATLLKFSKSTQQRCVSSHR